MMTPLRWWVPLLIVPLGVFFGIAGGAITNMINGAVSPAYFRQVMGWRDEIWINAVIQGIFEGVGFRAIVGVVTSISFAASTRFRGGFGLALRALLLAMMVALCGWVAGGLLGLIAPLGAPYWLAGELWAGGSIWGIYAGSLIGTIVSCMWLHKRWGKMERARIEGFTVMPIVPVMEA